MTHAGHRAYKKVDQKKRPCDLFLHVCDTCVLHKKFSRNLVDSILFINFVT